LSFETACPLLGQAAFAIAHSDFFNQSPKESFMNKLLITTACALILASWNALAVDEHHPDQAPAAKAPAPDTAKTVQKMQDNVKKMQGQIDRIAKTKDAKERQKLLQEHMQTMQENMMASRGMMGGMAGGMMDCPMMKDGMMGGGMGMMGGPGGGAGMSPDAMMGRMQMMEKRMDMMQMMMEQQMKNRQDAQPPVPMTK